MSDEEFKNRDFVYAGRRILKSDIIGHAVFPIGDDQQLMAERLYKLKPRLGFAIGGVYGGAQFAETKSYGVEKGFYKSQWHDKETAIGWEAQDHEAELSLSIIRLENNAKRQSELATALLPIRRAIHAANRRGDWHSATAIRQVVANMISKPLTKEELAE